MAGRSLFYLGNSWICSMPKKNLLNLKSANEFRKLKLLTPEWKHFGAFTIQKVLSATSEKGMNE